MNFGRVSQRRVVGGSIGPEKVEKEKLVWTLGENWHEEVTKIRTRLHTERPCTAIWVRKEQLLSFGKAHLLVETTTDRSFHFGTDDGISRKERAVITLFARWLQFIVFVLLFLHLNLECLLQCSRSARNWEYLCCITDTRTENQERTHG